MIYEYKCKTCHEKFDVWKSASEFTRTALCSAENCGGDAELVIHPPRGFINASVENAEFNPGLGCVVKNRAHRAAIAKARGLVEVGNEKTDTLVKHAERNLAEKLDYGEI